MQGYINALKLIPHEKLSSAEYFRATEEGLWTIGKEGEGGAMRLELYQIDLNLLIKPKLEYVSTNLSCLTNFRMMRFS